MSGHSHAANVARRKNAVDAKRGKLFSKLARAITSATRQGGGDPEQNLKLKYAIEKAKAGNMPKDNIERGEFTAKQYRAAWRHLLRLAPQRANLRATMILMQWTLDKPSRSVDDYLVPGLDVLAWDAYLTGYTKTTKGTKCTAFIMVYSVRGVGPPLTLCSLWARVFRGCYN